MNEKKEKKDNIVPCAPLHSLLNHAQANQANLQAWSILLRHSFTAWSILVRKIRQTSQPDQSCSGKSCDQVNKWICLSPRRQGLYCRQVFWLPATKFVDIFCRIRIDHPIFYLFCSYTKIYFQEFIKADWLMISIESLRFQLHSASVNMKNSKVVKNKIGISTDCALMSADKNSIF